MAYEGEVIRHAVPANADLSASQWCAIVINSSGKAAVAGANVRIDGVLADTPAAADRTASLHILGVTKMRAGAAVTNGDLLETDSTGRAVTSSTAGHFVIGKALAAASGANSVIPVLLYGSGFAHA